MGCPICQKDSDPRYRPFCSKRCADIDLGRWLTGSYVMSGPETESGDEVLPPPEKGLQRPH